MQIKLVRLLALGVTAYLAVGCASNHNPVHKPAGFLADYSILHQVQIEDKDAEVYIYKNKAVNPANYHAILIEPVILYQTTIDGKITAEQIANAQATIHQELTQQLAKKIAITTKPGPGVARLSVAITGAEVDQDGFKPRNLIPISAVIKLASLATGLNGKQAVLAIETKAVDSVSNQLLSASVTTIHSETFRLKASTPEEFMNLAKIWVQDAVANALTPKLKY